MLQAISHATDRQALIDSTYFGHGTANWQPFPDGYVAHSAELDDLYPHDVEAAEDLLAEAGYPDGVDITLTLGEDDTALAELLQAQWAEGRHPRDAERAGGGCDLAELRAAHVPVRAR